MSAFDLLLRVLGLNEFNDAWSEPLYHVLHDEIENFIGDGKVLKQVKRIFGYAKVPDTPGIYLIRDPYGTNVYVGQTYKQGLRTRLSQHFRERGSKALAKGIMYEIRWAETEGGEIPKIAEALAVLYFKPDGNDHKDWLGNLDRAFAKQMSSQIIGEAKRLGFLRGSDKEKEAYRNSLLKAVGRGGAK